MLQSKQEDNAIKAHLKLKKVERIRGICIPGNTKRNCRAAIPLVQAIHLIQPLQPLTPHQNLKIQLYPLNYWYAGKSRLLSGGEWPSRHRKALSFQVLSHSLSILHYLTLSLTSPLSSHKFYSTPENRPPSLVPKRLAFHLVEKPPNPTVFTLSLPHSFSYLTNSLRCGRSSPVEAD